MKIYKVNEFAKRIGKSTNTLRRWDREGTLQAKRHPSGHRYYEESDIHAVLGYKEEKRKIIVYCRVSSNNQKDDLKSQEEATRIFCLGSGIAVDEWISEIGSGLNFKRKKFLDLMFRISRGEVSQLIVAHKDRLCRFGFDFFLNLAKENDCKVVIINQEQLSPQQEMVEDLMAIIHVFSCRLYGLRKYKKKVKEIILEKDESN